MTKAQEVCYTDIAVKQEVTTEEKKLKKVVDKLEVIKGQNIVPLNT
ncbi:hypothetical protein [Streptococcus sp. FT1-106]